MVWHHPRNERLAYHSGRQACGSGDPRYDKRSHGGIWNIYRKYAQRGGNVNAESGIKQKGNTTERCYCLFVFQFIFLRLRHIRWGRRRSAF